MVDAVLGPRGPCPSVRPQNGLFEQPVYLTAVPSVFQAKLPSILWQRPVTRTQQLEVSESFRVLCLFSVSCN